MALQLIRNINNFLYQLSSNRKKFILVDFFMHFKFYTKIPLNNSIEYLDCKERLQSSLAAKLDLRVATLTTLFANLTFIFTA